jgi:hypothetical protein
MKWRIADDQRDEFVKKTLFSTRKGQARMDSSGPNSPALGNSTHATERLMGAIGHSDGIIPFPKQEINAARVKTPPRSQTPPLASYPTANNSYTPERGPRLQKFGGNHRDTSNGAQMHTPLPKRPRESAHNAGVGLGIDSKSAEDGKPQDNVSGQDGNSKPRGLNDSATDSPPNLYSDSAMRGTDTGRQGNAGLVTPLVARHAPRLAPPSTAQVPSQYINFSSPAPFWKYFDVPSTPADAPNLDISPIKMKKGDDDGSAEETAQPSSPPLMFEDKEKDADDGDEADGGEGDDDIEMNSPSRTLSRPVSRRDGPKERESERVPEPMPAAPSGLRTANGMVRGASLAVMDDDETDGIDLTK